MGLDDNSSSANSSSSTTVAASKQLQRRLNGLGRPQWSTKTDLELLFHLNSACSLLHLDMLSGCIAKMAEHVHEARQRDKQDIFENMTKNQAQGYAVLCRVLGCALQQLAEGVQQYLQQGQLPAALTERAVAACCALCAVLARICDWHIHAKLDIQSASQILRRLCYESAVQKGAEVSPAVHVSCC
jgi:hypothetical protein